VRRAGILARGGCKEVLLMHVVDGLEANWIAPHLREAQRIILEQIAVVPELAGVPCEPLVVEGSPCEAILDAAAAWEIDLIVMGAPRGRRAHSSGRIVKNLIRESQCPVLVVGPAAITPYAKILAPIELSDVSSQALESALSLKLIGEAEVTVLHAFEAIGKRKLSAFGVAKTHIDGYVSNWRSCFAEDVDVFLSERGFVERQWARRIVEGPPLEVICRAAQQMRPDLLIMGTHGRAGIRRVLTGSVTEEVLSSVDTDVLVVPPHRSVVMRPEPLQTHSAPSRHQPPESGVAPT